MIVKFDPFSRDFEQYSKFSIFLFHGSNEGKVIECKDSVLRFTRIQKRTKEVINIYSNEMKKEDFLTLTSQLKEQNIFGFMTILNIYLSNERNNQELIQLIVDIEKSYNKDVVVVIRSNQLPTRSKLRKIFETQDSLILVPCYEDDDFEKNEFIKDFF